MSEGTCASGVAHERSQVNGKQGEMKKTLWVMVCAIVLAGYSLQSMWGRPDVVLRGFFPDNAARQADVEETFREVPTPAQAEHDLWILTQMPHVAGTPADRKTAQYVLDQFREAGLDAKIVEYQVLLPMPKEVKVDLVEPFKQEGPTPEEGWSWDKDTYDAGVVPGFNAYSPSGDVTARVVYANYGLPDDYRQLKEKGIDVAGKIVIVRYGKCFRGVKAYVAEQNHAAGVLIYSDPADDGYRRGDVYPRGPWRPATGVQRGSILYLTAYAGDPLTPGIAAVAGTKRLSMEQAPTLPRIPTTPLSYADAAPILENLAGPVAPKAWQGALPFAYHLGPGESKVHLKLDMDFKMRTIWDVTGEVRGTTEPDSLVVVGNHRDAWTYGAVDPNSGTAPLLAVARGIGRLLKQGWKPRRTIILASWDAEEFGLIGSTEWAEDHADVLARHAVAYLNMDVGVCGPRFGAAAVPSLRRLIREVTEQVTDPTSGQPLYTVWARETAKPQGEAAAPAVVSDRHTAPKSPEARTGDLGSGSDYTPFLQHLGVPSLDIGFNGPYGVYHAIYDDFYWMQHFGDPTFKYSVAAAQVYGMLALRLADADVVPLDYEDYGHAIEGYLQGLQEELEKNGQGDKLDAKPAAKAAKEFTARARLLEEKITALTQTGKAGAGVLTAVNQDLVDVEHDFLLEAGLPDRAWFRHALYAPGVYTGYAAVVLPGVRAAMGRNDWATATQQLELVRAAIERGTATLNRALVRLGGR